MASPVEPIELHLAAVAMGYGLIQLERRTVVQVRCVQSKVLASKAHRNSRATARSQIDAFISECPDSEFECRLQEPFVAQTLSPSIRFACT